MKKYDLVKRKIDIGNGKKAVVDLNNPVYRFPGNPILTLHDVNKVWTNPKFQVKTVHNAGIIEHNGKTLMLFRSHLRSGVSILGLAKSRNGFDGWKVESYPAMLPCSKKDSFAKGVNKKILIENEAGGVEDPRIIKLDNNYLITYSAYHARIKDRVRVSLAVTKDFRTFTRYGPLLNENMRNVVIFPEKINDRYIGLFRLNNESSRAYTQIRIGFTKDWKSDSWVLSKKPIIKTGGGPSALSDKIGPGAPPIKTKYGWLSIFHGVRATMDGNPYVLSVALHDLGDPAKVKVSNIPILFPSKADCRVKDSDYVHVPNVVFTCGAIRKNNGTILIYYGGCDTVMNIGVTHEDILATLCKNYGQDPKTGKLLYDKNK
jgi:predicted GH43/DUF377 family glycosyl hydrolase